MSQRVSVILPTFNRADLIGETIDSLLAQDRPIEEILVIDDGSTDATPAVLAAYGDKIRCLTKPNGGKASALNLGLAEASGDLIWVCDDDDLVLPDACRRLVAALAEDPLLGWCAGRHEDFVIDPGTGAKRIKPPGYFRASKPDELFPDLLDGCHIFQPGMLVRRALYQQVGPFNLALTRSQDYEMLLRLARAAPGRLLEDIVFQHREHAGMRGSAAERFTMEQANAKWIRFHRMIMEPLIPALADQELLPASIWDDPARVETRARTASLKRASVYARNQLWPEAAGTWRSAAEVFSGPLDAYETSLVKGATLYSLGCGQLLEDGGVRREVLALRGVSPLGKVVVSLIGQSLRWRLKQAVVEGRFRDAAAMARFMLAAA